nr:MAG TPA: hypothetical protein [Caudoviricetes sp.]
MVVYANLKGVWTELGDNDYIEDETSEIFVNDFLSKKNLSTTNQFLRLIHDDKMYHIHISQIQWITSV